MKLGDMVRAHGYVGVVTAIEPDDTCRIAVGDDIVVIANVSDCVPAEPVAQPKPKTR